MKRVNRGSIRLKLDQVTLVFESGVYSLHTRAGTPAERTIAMALNKLGSAPPDEDRNRRLARDRIRAASREGKWTLV